MKRIICKCGKRMYVFRNQNKRNISIQYCENCKIYQVAHNETLEIEKFEGEK
jgi:hypothetical protein